MLLAALASGTVPLRGIAIVPVAGIVIGGAMTATSLGGRRRDAAMLACRPSATQALLPLDRTRTLGLVTLAGAFVGVLIGSGDPVQAATAQLQVRIGLLAVETAAVALVLELVARGAIRRAVPPSSG